MNPSFVDLADSAHKITATFVSHNVRDGFLIVETGERQLLIKMITRISEDTIYIYEMPIRFMGTGKALQAKINDGSFPVKHLLMRSKHPNADPKAYIVDGKFLIKIKVFDESHECLIDF